MGLIFPCRPWNRVQSVEFCKSPEAKALRLRQVNNCYQQIWISNQIFRRQLGLFVDGSKVETWNRPGKSLEHQSCRWEREKKNYDVLLSTIFDRSPHLRFQSLSLPRNIHERLALRGPGIIIISISLINRIRLSANLLKSGRNANKLSQRKLPTHFPESRRCFCKFGVGTACHRASARGEEMRERPNPPTLPYPPLPFPTLFLHLLPILLAPRFRISTEGRVGKGKHREFRITQQLRSAKAYHVYVAGRFSFVTNSVESDIQRGPRELPHVTWLKTNITWLWTRGRGTHEKSSL